MTDTISTAFSVSMDCNHCDDLDNTCGDCTIKIVKIAEAAEARAAELLKRLEEAQVYIGKLEDERDALQVQLDFEAAHSATVMAERDRANQGFAALSKEYDKAMTRLAAQGEKVTA